MDGFKMAILVMAIDDLQRERDHHGKRRQMTVAELDALADFDWPWPNLKRAMAERLNAFRANWQSRSIALTAGSPLSSAEVQ